MGALGNACLQSDLHCFHQATRVVLFTLHLVFETGWFFISHSHLPRAVPAGAAEDLGSPCQDSSFCLQVPGTVPPCRSPTTL